MKKMMIFKLFRLNVTWWIYWNFSGSFITEWMRFINNSWTLENLTFSVISVCLHPLASIKTKGKQNLSTLLITLWHRFVVFMSLWICFVRVCQGNLTSLLFSEPHILLIKQRTFVISMKHWVEYHHKCHYRTMIFTIYYKKKGKRK